MKINRFLLLFLLFVFLISINFAFASAENDTNLTSADCADLVNVNENFGSANLTSSPSNEAILNDNGDNIKSYIINQRNYKIYFDNNGVLKNDYGGSVLIFDGKFEDKGVFTINSPDTKITGRHALFNNTVFNLKADGVMLTNINFVLDKEFPENDYAGILIKSDNVSVYNCSIDYNVPSEKTGFAIFSNGEDWGNTCVNIMNNTVNYVGKSYGSGFNYGVLLTETFNATVSGNLINCSLPLRSVDWDSQIYGGSSMDFTAALVADTCRYLKLSDNRIYADVNGVRQGEPTLDAVMIYYCNDAIVENNIISETDYVTQKGNVNYLYALDMYLSKNVIIYGNDINVFTTGGKDAHGTAYPIQITGPALNVSVAFNKIKSYSNGPNIGIYSHNFYGETQLSIISNIINITGYASSDPWALVAGIEVQDSNDTILNNTIEVNSVNEFKTGHNLYGISYSQKTSGKHEYNIQYNKVKTSGDWAVALMGDPNSPVYNSIIANNVLKARKYGGNRAALITGGSGRVLNNTDGSKHVKRFISYDDYPEFLKNYLQTPSSANNPGFSWIAKVTKTNSNQKSDMGAGVNSNGNGKSNFNIGNAEGNNIFKTNSNEGYGNANSTHYIPGESGVGLAGALAGSSHGESSHSKAYEVTKMIKELDDFSYVRIIFSIFCLFLLIVGYKRNHDAEDY